MALKHSLPAARTHPVSQHRARLAERKRERNGGARALALAGVPGFPFGTPGASRPGRRPGARPGPRGSGDSDLRKRRRRIPRKHESGASSRVPGRSREQRARAQRLARLLEASRSFSKLCEASRSLSKPLETSRGLLMPLGLQTPPKRRPVWTGAGSQPHPAGPGQCDGLVRLGPAISASLTAGPDARNASPARPEH